jgi:asparagine synthase (glutamine-hydrolysing)
MCGINGILHFDEDRKVEEKQLTEMRDILQHRGPDGAGIYINQNIGLGHRRLAILDLSEKGIQPFSSDDNRYHVTFNGEIYNFKEIKAQLLEKGLQFRSETDTEVLMYLYILEGEKMLEKLNGMFAFAIWDNFEKTLFIARDRLGIKPFYYSIHDNTFYFASEQKALLKAGVPKGLNEDLFEELLLFRFISGENTLFKGIKKLLPGHCGVIKNGKFEIKRWWKLADKISEKKLQSDNDQKAWFEECFKDAVNYRTISDVPVGIMLSGGLDSSSVAAALKLKGHDGLTTFTVGFDEKEYNEGDLAEQVAKKFDYKYRELRIKGEQLYDELVKAAWLHDEPLIHQNDPQILALSRYAKKEVTVLLSGEAADELMGGYVRYKALRFSKLYLPIKLLVNLGHRFTKNNRIKKLKNYFSLSSADERVMFNSCNLYPDNLKNKGIQYSGIDSFQYRHEILNEAKKAYPNDGVRQAMYLDQHTFLCSLLDRNDRMTMGASIECRVPFLDFNLVEKLSSVKTKELIKGKKGKNILFKSMGKHLPEDVVNFKKWGFGVPWAKYLREDKIFSNALKEMKTSEIFNIGIFKHLPVKRMIDGFISGDNSEEILIRQLLMIFIWYKAYYIEF